MKTFPITVKASLTRPLILLSLIGFAYFVCAIVVLHVLRPDYNPISRVISEYAIEPYNSLMTSSFIALGLGSFALALALVQTVTTSRRSRLAFSLLTFWSVCLLVLSIFPTDPYGIPVSRSGIIHSLTALLAFISLLFASLLYSLSFRRNVQWRSFARASLTMACLIAVSLIVFLGSPVAFKGITERFLVFVVVL